MADECSWIWSWTRIYSQSGEGLIVRGVAHCRGCGSLQVRPCSLILASNFQKWHVTSLPCASLQPAPENGGGKVTSSSALLGLIKGCLVAARCILWWPEHTHSHCTLSQTAVWALQVLLPCHWQRRHRGLKSQLVIVSWPNPSVMVGPGFNADLFERSEDTSGPSRNENPVWIYSSSQYSFHVLRIVKVRYQHTVLMNYHVWTNYMCKYATVILKYTSI